MGSAFGVGVDENVEAVVYELQNTHSEAWLRKDLTINMCGWSRGAVTCFKIANRLSKHKYPGLRDVKIRIFAIDPVPGSDWFPNWHMWNGIELTDNVDAVKAILAEYDRRRSFAPILNEKMHGSTKEKGFSYDTMPGNHSGIVEQKGEYKAAFE